VNKLLIIDDDVELCAVLSERLKEDGFGLDAAHDGQTGLELAGSEGYALVILDVMLPRLSGMDLLRQLRLRSSVPVLMLTARGEDIDRIIGLESGADDYLAKPFNPRELVARIKAILRRLDDRKAGSSRIITGDIVVDVEVREASINGRVLHLTTIEFSMLEALVRNPGRTLSREYLTDVALGRELGLFDRSIDVHIGNLRKKLGEHHGAESIKTIRGSGYLFAPRRPNRTL
jgi:DNA-binding response OmpR family regulator